MRDGYENVNVISTCNSKFGRHTLLNYYDESGPLTAVGSVLCAKTDSVSHEICLSANNQINAMWASPEGNLWAIDDLGNVYTTAEMSFKNAPHNKLEYLAGPRNVQWAVTEVHSLGQLNAIWGAADHDVWVTSFSGKTFHWDGEFWLEYSLPKAPNAIHGSSPNDVYVVGYNGNISYWNGALWSNILLPESVRPNEPFTDVRALNAEQVYITGRGGVLLVGNASFGFNNSSTPEYSWYGVGLLEDRVFLAGGKKGIFELADNKLICLKDKGHPVEVCESEKSIHFIPAEQETNPWYVRYELGAPREWTKVNT